MSVLRKTRTISVNLYQGDDYGVLGEAALKLRNARRDHAAARDGDGPPAVPLRGGDLDPLTEAEEEYEEVLQAVLQRGTEVHLKALGRKEWRAHLAAHKPREDDVASAGDAEVGYNQDTFPDATIDRCLDGRTELTRDDGTTVRVDELTVTEREEWLEDLSDGECVALFQAAFAINESPPRDPKALLLGDRSGATGR